MSLRYGYLGPAGTFTQAALERRLGDAAAAEAATPFPTVPAALDAVREGTVDLVMVPIENSVEGGVSATLDALNSADPLWIRGEVLVPITFVLAAPAGVERPQVRAVGSHPHAWAQVRGWMARELPEAVHVPTGSTAAAAAELGAGRVGEYQAAVCAPPAAARHGLTVLARDIGDREAAVTRFVLVGRAGEVSPPTGADKTTLVLHQHADRPGGLLELLEQLAVRGINLTRLESRPTGAAMGSYCFSVDLEGHLRDERVADALLGLHRVCAQVRFLGSYPRADEVPAQVLPTATDASYEAARTWLRSLDG